MIVMDMIIWFGIIWVVSLGIRYLYHYVEWLRGLLSVITFIGVFIHELGHALMCILFGAKITSFSVKFRSEYTGRVSPHGSVGVKKAHLAFLQMVMISIGPIIFSTWIFLICMDFLQKGVEEGVGFFLLVVMVSTLFGASPSRPDINNMSVIFDIDPLYSLYQIGLVAITFSIVYFFIDFTVLVLPMELLYYTVAFFIVVFIYYGLKYGLLLIKYLLGRVFHMPKVSFRHKTRKRHKPYEYGMEDEDEL